MKPEQGMRKRVVAALRPLHGFSVENVVHPGTPDVACTLGWLELKVAAPRKRTGILTLEHLTAQQSSFLKRHCECGGMAALVVMVGREWFFVHGSLADRVVGTTLEELRNLSSVALVSPGPAGILAAVQRLAAPTGSRGNP